MVRGQRIKVRAVRTETKEVGVRGRPLDGGCRSCIGVHPHFRAIENKSYGLTEGVERRGNGIPGFGFQDHHGSA